MKIWVLYVIICTKLALLLDSLNGQNYDMYFLDDIGGAFLVAFSSASIHFTVHTNLHLNEFTM